MKILINALNHDAGICLIEDNKILFAAHAERYSGIKNDPNLNLEMFMDMWDYGVPNKIVYFENPYVKKMRQLYAGQYREVFSRKNMPHNHLTEVLSVVEGSQPRIDQYVDHHLSHASSTYFTSPYDESVVCMMPLESLILLPFGIKGDKLEKRWSLGIHIV